MQHIIKVPKRLHRVEILRADSIIMDSPARSSKKSHRKDGHLSDDEAGNKVVVTRPVFTEEFTFSDSNEPVEIKLPSPDRSGLTMEEVQKEVQDAYERGFEDGRELTRSTLDIELEKQQHWLRSFDTLVQELRLQFSYELEKLGESIASLALMSAAYILDDEVKAKPDIVIGQVKRALAAIDYDTVFKIRVHPYDKQILENVNSIFANESSKIERAVLLTDENIEQGSCILETSAGIIDARFSTQLERIRTTLENTVTDTLRDTEEQIIANIPIDEDAE